MAYKKPIIATNVGGVKNIIFNNKNGFCIRINDKKDFKKKMKLLIYDKKLRFNMGDYGFNFVKKNYSIKNLLNKMEDIYLKEIKKRNE